MMKLVSDWRESWKWFSTQIFAIIAVLPMVWVSLPADVKVHIPSKYGVWIVFVLAIAGVVGRVIDQKPNTNP